MATTATDVPDLSGFLMGHAALRREFGLLADLAAQWSGGNKRARLAADQLEMVLSFLHDHHTGEDREIWPLLRSRAPHAAGDLDALEAEHRDLDPLLVAAGDVDRPLPERARDLRLLHERMGAHLDHEERVVLPLLRAHVSAAEWTAMEQRAAGGLDRRRLPTLVGWLTSAADEDVRRAAAAAAPAAQRLLFGLVYRLWLRPAYARRSRALYGTSRG